MTDSNVAAQECSTSGAGGHAFEKFQAREVLLGGLRIMRALPIRQKRLVGPWCFLDRFGPQSFTESKPLDVAAHPHIGLQTFTWLLEGEILHKDSLGNEGLLQPGGVNVMTSGGGIAHAEESPMQNSGLLNGVQLWVALPDAWRNGAASFQHLGEVPRIEQRDGTVNLFAGSLLGNTSSARHFSPLLGADLEVRAGGSMELPLDPSFEHAVLLLSGDAKVNRGFIEQGSLYYLGINRSRLEITSGNSCRMLLLGGPPFPETILMWWNFVARSPQEIERARSDWQNHERFGEVPAYRGPRLDAPPLTRFAAANPAS